MAEAGMSGGALYAALLELRDGIRAARLPLELPGAALQRATASELVAQLDDYVLPRLATLDAPLLAVVGGSTGAGKSTLVNSLIGRRVTTPGIIRPTTRAPVLIHHPDDAGWFADERILPSLARTWEPTHDHGSIQLVAEDTLPRGLALLDAPDVDSVVEENRRLAAQLLAAADLWLFVTSAARYADAVPWEFLRHAAERSAAVAVVLDRIPPQAMAEIPPDLGRLMSERGLAQSPLFAVPEVEVDEQGLLPDASVQPIRSWLATLAADRASRQRVVEQTLAGAIASIESRAPGIARAIDDQQEALDRLREDVDTLYAETARSIAVQTADGTLLRGEVMQRWQDFVGTGELLAKLDEGVSRLRDRIVAMFRPKRAEANSVKLAVESGLEALIREQGEAAAERAEASWRANPAGRQLLADAGVDLSRASREYPAAVARTIRDWQGSVLDLVADAGMDKRSQARFLALGVNGAGVALMIVIFAQTGGLTGAEIGVAGGTAALAQRVLESVFGDDAIRRLTKQAKAELDSRVEALLDSEKARFHALLEHQHVARPIAQDLRSAVAGVQLARTGHSDPALTAARTPEGTAAGTPALPGAPREITAGGAGPAYAIEPAEEIVEAEIVGETRTHTLFDETAEGDRDGQA